MKNAKQVVAAILNDAKKESQGSPKFWGLYGELQKLAMAGDQLAEAAMDILVGVGTTSDDEMLSDIL